MEALKAINARLIIAINMLESGKIEEAKAMLERLSKTLPDPDQRHKSAAERN